MLIFDLNYLEPTPNAQKIEGGRRKRSKIRGESFANAESFAFVDDSRITDYEAEEIEVSASTFVLVELGRSRAGGSSFSLFKGGFGSDK